MREWECRKCGIVLDRDYNAALNLEKAAGFAVSGRGRYVRRPLAVAKAVETSTEQMA